MCSYIIKNPNSYVFSSLTVSVDSDIVFTPVSEDNPCLGTIRIAMNAKCLINDGQHRKAAIEAALKTLTYGSTREILRQVDLELGAA